MVNFVFYFSIIIIFIINKLASLLTSETYLFISAYLPLLEFFGDFMCNKCGRSYKRLESLKTHQAQQCGKPKEFFCDYCPYKSKLKSNLKRHLYSRHSKIL